MRSEISFCPVCAGKLDSGKRDQYSCEECEMEFVIEVVDEDDADDEDEEDEEDDGEEKEKDEEDEY